MIFLLAGINFLYEVIIFIISQKECDILTDIKSRADDSILEEISILHANISLVDISIVINQVLFFLEQIHHNRVITNKQFYFISLRSIFQETITKVNSLCFHVCNTWTKLGQSRNINLCKFFQTVTISTYVLNGDN